MSILVRDSCFETIQNTTHAQASAMKPGESLRSFRRAAPGITKGMPKG